MKVIKVQCPGCGSTLAIDSNGLIKAEYSIARKSKVKIWNYGQQYFGCYNCEYSGLYISGCGWESWTQNISASVESA